MLKPALAVTLAAPVALGQVQFGANPSPYLEKTKPQDWTLVADLTAQSYRPNLPSTVAQTQELWAFNQVAVVFPLLLETGSSMVPATDGAAGPTPELSGYLEIDDQRVDVTPEITKQTYHSGSKLVFWRPERAEYRAKQIEMHFEEQTECWGVRFDEDKASKLVDWPTGPWPDAAASTLNQPQLYVEHGPDANGRVGAYDMTSVDELVKKWTGGEDPKSIKPVPLAKWLAGSLAQEFQPTGTELVAGPIGFEGFLLKGAPGAALDMKGSEFDMVCLLAAVYRRAGLPARIVIGYDAEAAKGKRDYLNKKSGESAIRAWVEFCLYDESTDSCGWVPVDIVQMRKRHSRLPSNWMNRPLSYFGTNDELDGIVPIAFGFHPETSVVAYNYPALWGMTMSPAPPSAAEQGLRLQASRTAKRGNGKGSRNR